MRRTYDNDECCWVQRKELTVAIALFERSMVQFVFVNLLLCLKYCVYLLLFTLHMDVGTGDETKEVEERNRQLDFETDPRRIQQRQRQIDFGKNTIGYQRYLEHYPVKRKRPRHLPRTPNVYTKCSKRAFDGQIRAWRRRLHEWDLPENGIDGPTVASERIHISPDMRGDRHDQSRDASTLQNSEVKQSTNKRGRCAMELSSKKQKKMHVTSRWSDIVCKPSAMNPSDMPEDILVSYSDDEFNHS